MSPLNPSSPRHLFAAAALSALVLVAAPLSAQDESIRTLVTADRLIDGFGNVQQPGAVLVEGERIVAVGDAARSQDHDDRVDLGDATLMPGLIDLHT
ncbi:MAG: hypothetical protein L7S64_07975, partial [Longimicrobiales bacterium]|nr:hypothetical protein [Longimicrobiales bacterium]